MGVKKTIGKIFRQALSYILRLISDLLGGKKQSQ